MSIYQKFIESSARTTTASTSSSAPTTPKSTSINLNLLQFNNYHSHHHHLHQHRQPIFNSSSATSSIYNIYNNDLQQHRHECDRFFSSSTKQLDEVELPNSNKTVCDYDDEIDEFKRNGSLDWWLCELKYEPELEPMSCMEAPTLTYDKSCASAMSIRCSQVLAQEIRLESKVIFNYIELLIKTLPIKLPTDINKFHSQFNKLKVILLRQLNTKATSSNNKSKTTTISINDVEQSPLTITFTTPKKPQSVVTTLKPINKLTNQIKNLCNSYKDLLIKYDHTQSYYIIDNGFLESELRTLRELYEKFLYIIIRAECINIVESLYYNSQRISSSSSTDTSRIVSINKSEFEPIKSFESSYSNIPLKWALIALWQLTYNDDFVCAILTEKWFQETETPLIVNTLPKRVARKLDFSSTNENNNNDKYHETNIDDLIGNLIRNTQQQLIAKRQASNVINSLVHLIINQPNKHQRIDVMKFMNYQKTNTKLIDLDETYQQVASAVFTINQYKVAALTVLINLTINDEASKRILQLFFGSTDNNNNKLIESIFKSYLKELDHTYENDHIIGCDIEEEHCEQPVIREALRLIIQITNRFHSNQNASTTKDYYLKLIDYHTVESFVKYITNIITFTSDKELLLLSLNSIANISFITIEPMNSIIMLILKDIVLPKDLAIRDQALTILANVAGEKPSKLIEQGGLTFLLSGLISLTSTKSSTTSDLLAIERIQQKTAVAIGRISMEISCVNQIIERGLIKNVLKNLIDLCKYGHMRNYSCTVLVACLEALKLLAKYIDRNDFKYYNALDLIELNQNVIIDIYGQKI